MRKLSRPIAVTGAVFGAVMALIGTTQAVPANASSVHARAAASPSSPRTVRITVPMRIIGFDAAVAKAHGYVIHTDSHGRAYSVKAGTASAATPNNRVYGNCGSGRSLRPGHPVAHAWCTSRADSCHCRGARDAMENPARQSAGADRAR